MKNKDLVRIIADNLLDAKRDDVKVTFGKGKSFYDKNKRRLHVGEESLLDLEYIGFVTKLSFVEIGEEIDISIEKIRRRFNYIFKKECERIVKSIQDDCKKHKQY